MKPNQMRQQLLLYLCIDSGWRAFVFPLRSIFFNVGYNQSTIWVDQQRLAGLLNCKLLQVLEFWGFSTKVFGSTVLNDMLLKIPKLVATDLVFHGQYWKSKDIFKFSISWISDMKIGQIPHHSNYMVAEISSSRMPAYPSVRHEAEQFTINIDLRYLCMIAWILCWSHQ